MMQTHIAPSSFGLIARFDSVEALMHAAERVRDAGYTRVDAYTPFPIEGLTASLGLPKTKLPALVLAAGIIGGLTGFGMQYFAQVIHYPYNIGGKPLYSWPAWIPITFEVTILFAAFTAAIAMIVLNGLPQPYHPVFNVKGFERATEDRFFISIESTDPKFEEGAVRDLFRAAGAAEVSDVPL